MLWRLASALAIAMPALAVSALVHSSEMVRPDFSAVTSLAAAKALAAKGRLVEVLLFPAELGGQDLPENRVYITPEAAAAQRLMIGTLQRFVREGLINKMTVEPEYKGDSYIPSRIVMHATHSKKKGGFSPTIEIW